MNIIKTHCDGTANPGYNMICLIAKTVVWDKYITIINIVAISNT